ncbi:hypothetical protein [Primorskyibacter sp. S87]
MVDPPSPSVDQLDAALETLGRFAVTLRFIRIGSLSIARSRDRLS